jgi:cell division protein FtsL
MYNRSGYGRSRDCESFVMLGALLLVLLIFLLTRAVNLVRTAFEKQP